MTSKRPLVLASASPRRRQLLADLGWFFEVCPADVDERLLPEETPEASAERLARTKASAVAERRADALVLAADTLVAVDEHVLGKPETPEEALHMLRLLNGRRHRVLTGVALWREGELRSAVETTRVRFRALPEEALRAYLASGEYVDKAGAYAIQGKGALLVEGIEGCYFNVVGLPLVCLSRLLENIGWEVASQWTESGG